MLCFVKELRYLVQPVDMNTIAEYPSRILKNSAIIDYIHA